MRPLRRGDSPYGLALREGYAVYIHRQAVMCPLHRQVKAAALIEGIGRQILRPHRHLYVFDSSAGELIQGRLHESLSDAAASIGGVYGDTQDLSRR